MHILFLTDNFFPEVNAPASRTFEHCREWVRLGHKVTVITGVPNFPKGKVFNGYKNRLYQKEVIEGISIIRVWTYISANEGFLRRTVDYLSFMVAAFFASFFVRGVNVLVGTSPQFFTVCAAYLAGKFKRVPWVFELRDVWPESIRVVGAMKPGIALRFLEAVEVFLYRNADAIISVTHSFKESLIERGIRGDKIHVVTNGVDASRFSPREKDVALIDRLGFRNKFIVGYIGTHGLAHSLDTILDAAKVIDQKSEGDRLRFLFLGDGAQKSALVKRAKSENIRNVVFVDSVSKEEVARYWSILDASIIHLKNDPLFSTVIPSKLFECMGMAIPVIHGVKGESADIVEREGVGVLFEPENASALIVVIERLSHDALLCQRLSANGPTAARRFDRATLATSMLSQLLRLGGKSP